MLGHACRVLKSGQFLDSNATLLRKAALLAFQKLQSSNLLAVGLSTLLLSQQLLRVTKHGRWHRLLLHIHVLWRGRAMLVAVVIIHVQVNLIWVGSTTRSARLRLTCYESLQHTTQEREHALCKAERWHARDNDNNTASLRKRKEKICSMQHNRYKCLRPLG